MERFTKRILILIITAIIFTNLRGIVVSVSASEIDENKACEEKEIQRNIKDELKEDKPFEKNIVKEAKKNVDVAGNDIEDGNKDLKKTIANEDKDITLSGLQAINYNEDVIYTFPSDGQQSFQFYVAKPGRVEIIIRIDPKGWYSSRELYLNKSPSGELIFYHKTNGFYDFNFAFYLEEGYYDFTAQLGEGDKINLKAIYDDCKTSEKEPNDLREEANELKFREGVTGIFDNDGIDERDWYKFTVPSSGYVEIEYLNYMNTDMTGFKMYKGDDYQPFIDEHIGSSGDYYEPVKSSNGYYLEPGIYYIQLKEDYRGKYSIKLDFYSAGTTEKEPNDYSKYANTINFNEDIKGMLGTLDRVDWHKITLKNKTKVYISEWVYSEDTLYAYIYSDPSDTPIHRYYVSKSGASWSEPKQEKEEVIELDPGTYYIKVYGDDYYSKYMLNFKTQSFTDTVGHWAEKEIEYFVVMGYIDTSKLIFRPNDSITRAEFIKLVNKNFGFNAKASSENYNDVNTGDWWYNEVLIALKAGYISSSNSKFRPNDPITREEVAAIVTSIKNNKDTNLNKIQKYRDYNDVSTWARTSVEGAIEAGYMGMNSDMFNPKKNISRAESIVTLYRIK